MPEVCLDRATEQSQKCDLSLCMGTSMRVMPACELPAMNVKSGKKKMVIVSKCDHVYYIIFFFSYL